MLIGEMVTEDNSKLIKDLYAYHLALVANSGLSEDSFKSTQESARKNLDQLIAVKRPWEENEREDRIANEMTQYKEDFKELFDIDLDDEEQKKAHMEAYNKLQEEGQRAGEAQESESDTLERRVKAVEERRRRARNW